MGFRTTKLKSNHLKILRRLSDNKLTLVREMKFMSLGSIYALLRELVEWGFISRHYVQNISSYTGRKYIKAFKLTEKGKEYIETKKEGEENKVIYKKTTKLNISHQRILQSLFLNDEMIAKDMNFMSTNNIYKPLRELCEKGLISRRFVRNVKSGRGCKRYIQSYKLTEKGRDYIEKRRWRV